MAIMTRFLQFGWLTLLGFVGTAAWAASIQTNNPEIVVKQVLCQEYDVRGVLVNKSAENFNGILHIAVKDEEGDVVGRNKVRLRVSAENGARFSFYYINTLNCKKHTFDFFLE